jgi:predicted nucleic acid-binding Zn ribbon protein
MDKKKLAKKEHCKLCGRFIKRGTHYCDAGCQQTDEIILEAKLYAAYYLGGR